MTQIDPMGFSRQRMEYEHYQGIYRGVELVRLWRNNRYVWRWCDVHDIGRNEPVAPMPAWEDDSDPIYALPYEGKKRGHPGSKRPAEVARYMRQHGPQTAQNIASHYGWHIASTRRMLRDSRLFERHSDPTVHKGRQYLWSVAE